MSLSARQISLLCGFGASLGLGFACAHAQGTAAAGSATLPDDPSATLQRPAVSTPTPTSVAAAPAPLVLMPAQELAENAPYSLGHESASQPADASDRACSSEEAQQGAGEPGQTATPVNRTGQQPKRILGLMPNYRSVSSGTVPPPPTVKQNFKIATRQAFDYSSFVFLGITSAAAYAQGSHPSLDTYNGGDAVFWAYIWRGFVDKTDGNYLAAFILPTILREDTRYYAMGQGSKWKRLGYAASRVVVARTYGGRTTPNLAGIGGKVAAQAISPYYYPPGSSDLGVLATKFAYAMARDMGFTIFREFYPDIAIHVLHRNP